MTTHYLFRKPAFTAKAVAEVVGKELGRTLGYTEADPRDELDGSVDVTEHVHIQVGGDYLVVCGYKGGELRSWPPRPNIPWALNDLREALRQYPPGPAS